MVVVGAGVIGIEYASIFAALGTKVTVVEKRDRCSSSAIRGRGGPEVPPARSGRHLPLRRGGHRRRVGTAGTVTTLASGKQIPAETVMYSAGREGQTDHLDRKAGLADDRGRIFVDDEFQTKSTTSMPSAM